ncbi:MAG: hypothetical protein ABIJ00_09925 [Candidatus Eisenbacteria bacterium]
MKGEGEMASIRRKWDGEFGDELLGRDVRRRRRSESQKKNRQSREFPDTTETKRKRQNRVSGDDLGEDVWRSGQRDMLPDERSDENGVDLLDFSEDGDPGFDDIIDMAEAEDYEGDPHADDWQ